MATNRFASARSTAAQSATDAAATKAGAGTINPTATARAFREEAVAARPKFGSNPLQRAGADPLYQTDPQSGQGIQSSRNASAASFDKFFHPVDWAGGGTPATPGVAPAVSPVAAPTAGPFSGFGGNVPRGTISAGESTLGWPHVDWTGPNLMPQVGPGSAAPFVPGQQGTNFTVPKPLTGPGGNAGTDASDLAANRALAAPGGASGLWNGAAPTYTPAPGDFARVDYVPHSSSSPSASVDWSSPAVGTLPQPPSGVQTPSGVTLPAAQAKPKPDDEEEGAQKSASNSSHVDAYSSES